MVRDYTTESPPELAPLRLQQELPPPPHIGRAATTPAEASPSVRTLVLYDRTGRWGWLGELYATMTANLASHFGSWEAKPAVEYERGEIERYTAAIYVGSTYGEPLPAPFLDVSAEIDTPSGERGLLGLAFHPDYAENGRFFVTFSSNRDAEGFDVTRRSA